MRGVNVRFLAAVLAAALSATAGAGGGQTVSRVEGRTGKIALTFDDGPHARYTGEILDVLAEYGVKATFFVIGENAEMRPGLVKREVEEGHEIGNHTFDHKSLKKASFEEAEEQILKAEEAIVNAAGVKPRLFRPPEGRISEAAEKAAAENGYTVVLWSVDTRDWTHLSARRIAAAAKEAKDGDVILCHDFISGESHTADALRIFIPALLERGFEFVTVSELIGGSLA